MTNAVLPSTIFNVVYEALEGRWDGTWPQHLDLIGEVRRGRLDYVLSSLRRN